MFLHIHGSQKCTFLTFILAIGLGIEVKSQHVRQLGLKSHLCPSSKRVSSNRTRRACQLTTESCTELNLKGRLR